MSEKNKEYGYRRNPDSDSMSLEGTETRYLLRLLTGINVNEDYKQLIRKELKIREFSDEEIKKYEFL